MPDPDFIFFMRDIPEHQRGELFAQLAAMEDAGIPPDRALKTIAASTTGKLSQRAEQSSRLVSWGRAVDIAGASTGLFTKFEAQLLHTVIQAGSPAPVYRRLGRFYDQRVRHRRAMKSKLLLPAVILVAAIFLAPLPKLFTGSLAFADYLAQTFGLLLLIAVNVVVLRRFPVWLRAGWLKDLNPANRFDVLILHVPVLGLAEIRRNRTQFLQVLCLLLESAIPVFSAVPLAADTVGNTSMKEDFNLLAGLLESGENLYGAFSRSAYMDGSSLLVTAAGEATGDTGQVICRYADMEQQRLEQFYGELASWLPRIFYFLVVIIMAWQIISGFPGPTVLD